MVTALDVASFLGRGNDARVIALAGEHVDIVTTFVKAYVRDRGFVDGQPNDDLRAVIVSATARSVRNPENLQSYSSGDYSETPAVAGFTLPETFVLNRYRKRSA